MADSLLPDRFVPEVLDRYGDSLASGRWRLRVRCAMRDRRGWQPEPAVFAALCREFNLHVREAGYWIQFLPLHGDAMQALLMPRSDYLYPDMASVSYLFFFRPVCSVERVFRKLSGEFRTRISPPPAGHGANSP